MPICVFPPHYQLVYISFDISSFSVISYVYGNYYLRVNKYFSTRKEIINVRFLKKHANLSNSLKLHFHSIKEYKDAASDHTYICN